MTDALLGPIYTLKKHTLPWKLEEIYSPGILRNYAAGRAALKAALQLLGVGQGDSVLFPSLICREVLWAATELGAKINYYHVNSELKPKDAPETWPKCKVVLAVDYFGFPQDLAPFKEYCSKNNAALIEDNAHAIFSRDENGCLLGTRGDMGILSQRKLANIPNGGALILNPGSVTLAPEQIAYQDTSNAGYKIKLGLKRLSAVISPWLAIKTIAFIRTIKGVAADEPLISNAPDMAPSPECASLWPFFGVKEETERRIAIYNACNNTISSLGGTPVFATLPKGTCPYVYPFYADKVMIVKIKASALKSGLDIFSWPTLPDEIAGDCADFYNNIYCVRFLW